MSERHVNLSVRLGTLNHSELRQSSLKQNGRFLLNLWSSFRIILSGLCCRTWCNHVLMGGCYIATGDEDAGGTIQAPIDSQTVIKTTFNLFKSLTRRVFIVCFWFDAFFWRFPPVQMQNVSECSFPSAPPYFFERRLKCSFPTCYLTSHVFFFLFCL